MTIKDARIVAYIAVKEVDDASETGNPASRRYLLELVTAGNKAIGDGVADGEMDLYHVDRSRTVNSGANDDLDLTDLAGGTAASKAAADNFARVCLLGIVNNGSVGATGQIRVGNEGSTPWEGSLFSAGATIDIPGGGFLLYYDPAGRTTSSNNLLRVAGVSANQDYGIVIGGQSS